ncbi:hypothetical protein DMA11_13225 [Marinilabiliaceae bacterium JC017]|nr:hypothetical protein DMA11_13225 [Marinilabiliaceae bacterium JC017]
MVQKGFIHFVMKPFFSGEETDAFCISMGLVQGNTLLIRTICKALMVVNPSYLIVRLKFFKVHGKMNYEA